MNQPDAGRYAYHVLVLVMPAIGLLLTRLASTRLGIAVVVTACVAMALVGAKQLRRDADAQAAAEQEVRAQVDGAAAILRDATAEVVAQAPIGAVLLSLRVDDVRRWIAEGLLPTITPTEEGTLRAATELQIEVGRSPLAPVVTRRCRMLSPGNHQELRPSVPVSWRGQSKQAAYLRVGFVEASGTMHTRPVRLRGTFFLSDLHPGANFVVLNEGGGPIELCTGALRSQPAQPV